MTLQGTIKHLAECGVRTEVPVRIEFPAEYPAKPPKAFDAAHTFTWCPDRHIESDGAFCLSLTPTTDWRPNDPNALVGFLDQVSVFIERQIIYSKLPAPAGGGKRPWPGGEWAHGRKGYQQYVLELLQQDRAVLAALAPVLRKEVQAKLCKACPCGSNRKYGECHQPVVERILANVPADCLIHLTGQVGS